MLSFLIQRIIRAHCSVENNHIKTDIWFHWATDAWLIQDINKNVKTVGHKVTPQCVEAGEILKDAICQVSGLIVWTAVTFRLDV